MNFIKEFPHVDIIKNKRVDALTYNMANANGRHINYYKRKAKNIKELANNSYPGVPATSKDVKNLKQLVDVIIEQIKQRDELRNKMIGLAKQTKNFENIVSIFGIGELSAALIKENAIYVYYQKKKQAVKHYCACLTACSTKLIRIIYALCMKNYLSKQNYFSKYSQKYQ